MDLRQQNTVREAATSIRLTVVWALAACAIALAALALPARAASISGTVSSFRAQTCANAHEVLRAQLYSRALRRCGKAKVGRRVPAGVRYRQGNCSRMGGGDGSGYQVSGSLNWQRCVNRRGSF